MRKRERFSPDYKLEAIKGVDAGRSKGLTAKEASKLYSITSATYFEWKNRYERDGMLGLQDRRDSNGKNHVEKPEALINKVKEVSKEYPGYGNEKLSAHLLRWHFMKACAGTVKKILGMPVQEVSTQVNLPTTYGPTIVHRRKQIAKKRHLKRNKPKKVRFFERAKPNELWQMDIMTFMLKGQYRIYLIGVLDDNSRFMVNHGIFRRQTEDNVIDVLRGAIEKHGCPKEVLTDNGRQFYSWRGKSKFSKTCIKLGINHIRSRPYHPQTLGKIESFWRNLYQEFLGEIPLSSFEEAQSKIADWIKYYNYSRVHLGIGNLVPADRFFSVREQVEKVIEEGVAATEKAMRDNPAQAKPPVYLVGKIGEQEIRILAKDGEVIMGNAPAVDSRENNIAKSVVVEPLSSAETRVTGQENANPPSADEVCSDGTQSAGKPAQPEPESARRAGDANESNSTTTAAEGGGQIPQRDKRPGEEGTDIESSARQDDVAGSISGTEHQQGSVLPVDEEGAKSAGRIACEHGPREEICKRSGTGGGTGEIAPAEQRHGETKPETAGEIEYSRQNNGMGEAGHV